MTLCAKFSRIRRAGWALGGVLLLAAGSAAGAEAMTFKLNSWVCQSPETYDQVAAEMSNRQRSLSSLMETYKSSCVYMDDDNIEDMLPPFVKVLGTEGNKTKVSFFVEFYKKFNVLHAKITHVRFVGWTAAENVLQAP